MSEFFLERDKQEKQDGGSILCAHMRNHRVELLCPPTTRFVAPAKAGGQPIAVAWALALMLVHKPWVFILARESPSATHI